MKLLLVQSYLAKEEVMLYPLGLVCVASSLDKHEVRIFDLNLYEDPFAELEKHLVEYQPNIVGISLRNIDNQDRINTIYYYKDFVRTIRKVKAVTPKVQLVAGGAGYSMFARKIMERNDELDFGVYLEGEQTFGELLDNLDNPGAVQGLYYRENGEVKFTGERELPELDSLPKIQRSYADMSAYDNTIMNIGVESKRGCLFDCVYCNYPFLNGNRIRQRKPEDVVDEIENMVNESGIRRFTFVDPIFNVPIDHASQICREIIKRHLDVSWGAYMHVKYAPEEFLLTAREAGCEAFVFSPDGASDNALKSLRKGITEAELRKVYTIFRTNEKLKDVFVLFTLMLSPPGGTFHDLLKTLWFHTKAKHQLRGRGGAIASWIRIEPETRIYKTALENGALKKDFDLLPEIEAQLQNAFYVHPHLKIPDTILIHLMKMTRLSKKN